MDEVDLPLISIFNHYLYIVCEAISHRTIRAFTLISYLTVSPPARVSTAILKKTIHLMIESKLGRFQRVFK